MNPVIEILLSALLLISSFFTLVGAIGLVRLREFFKRIHAPTKATTLGVGCVLIVSIFYHAVIGDSFNPRELMISLFLFITAPISAHMMAKADLSLRLKKRPQCPTDQTPDPDEDDDQAGAPDSDLI